jgi:transposase
MIRQLKVVRDTAVKSRTQAMVTLKTLIVTAPADLREQLDRVADRVALVRYLTGLRPGPLTSTTASTKAALKALARRWLMLDAEIKEHDAALDALMDTCASGLKATFGIATGTVAEMLILVGDNPERIRSEAAFAKLCGVCPVPASSGKTTRHRLNQGGNRKAKAALYRVVITRMRSHPPTLAYVKKRLAQGKTKREIVRCLKP